MQNAQKSTEYRVKYQEMSAAIIIILQKLKQQEPGQWEFTLLQFR